jgi:dGTPase
MEWAKLLANQTFRPRTALKDFDGRDQFENDYSRVISSTFIRRLQDKTQVFPLQESDFIRTRLTHSLEVSSIARSLGKSVEGQLIKKQKLDGDLKGQIPSLLTIAGLIHDLGNPPYGHFGETAIQKYFSQYFVTGSNSNGWTEQQMKDMIYFDGNVQTLRILRKLSFMGDEYSYNLSFPTLASIIKYPRSSTNGNKKSTGNVADKKFGYFCSEEEDFKTISESLETSDFRHPVVFLLEAADDIAYSAADIEDGVKLGTLDFEVIYETFEKELKDGTVEELAVLTELKRLYGTFKEIPSDRLDLSVRKFRIYTQSLMIQASVTEFLENHDAILDGRYKDELILKSAAKNIRKAYKNLATKVFNSKSVMQTELAGWEILNGLLEIFVNASRSANFNGRNNSVESRLYNMISSSLRHMFENYPSIYPGDNEEYRKIQLIIDFVSGMTDSYALGYFQRLKGIKI